MIDIAIQILALLFLVLTGWLGFLMILGGISVLIQALPPDLDRPQVPQVPIKTERVLRGVLTGVCIALIVAISVDIWQ